MVNVILMLCTGGLSSQMFLKSVLIAAQEQGFRAKIDYASVLYDPEAVQKYSDFDYLFLFAPATEITKDAIDTTFLKINTIMISPQVRYMSASIKQISIDAHINCLVLEPETFAELAGKECFQIIKWKDCMKKIQILV